MSVIERFNYLEFSDSTKFTRGSTGRIELREYSDDLLLYSSFDSVLNATYAASDATADTTGSPSVENFGVFGQQLSFASGGTVTYRSSNFTDLTDQGCIKFRVKPNFTKGYGHQDFVATDDPTIAGDTIYRVQVYYDDTLLGGDSTSISLLTTDTMTNINTKLYAELNGNGAETQLLTAGNIRVLAETQGDSILLLAGTGNDLITLLGGVNTQQLPNPPSVTAKLFDIYNGTNTTNRITLSHKQSGDSLTEGHLILDFYKANGDSQIASTDLGIWNVAYDTWYAFEFNWNKSIYQFFVDGEQFAVSSVGTTRTNTSEKVVLQATSTNPYRFDELIVYNEYQNAADFTVATEDLPQYSTDDPYADIYFGTGFIENEVRDLNVTCSDGCAFVVKIGSLWYYYLSSAWIISDGTYSQSVTPAILETKFAELAFNADADLIVRTYFHSDGSTLQYVDELEIVVRTGDSVAAIIVGTVNLSDGVDVSSNYNFVINGETVDLRTGVGDSEDVSLAEIKTAIDAASIDDLDSASNDGDGHLVLMSLSRGTDASVEVSAAGTYDALSIVWGYAATDEGEEALVGDYVDYSELFRYVRSQLGEPIIPVELTDEQLEDCLAESIYWYNYYRNSQEKVEYISLSGNNTIGYDIPAFISPESILDIVLRPRFPFMYYAGREDIVSNLYMQYIFQRFKSGYTTFLTDYYITLTTEADLNIILGTQVKWEIINRKLFIYPDPLEDMAIAIRYAGALTLAEINANRWVKKFTLAEAKIVLGGIRSVFKSGIPLGSEMAVLNGEDLISQGNAEKEKLMDELKKMSEPLFIEFF